MPYFIPLESLLKFDLSISDLWYRWCNSLPLVLGRVTLPHSEPPRLPPHCLSLGEEKELPYRICLLGTLGTLSVNM